VIGLRRRPGSGQRGQRGRSAPLLRRARYVQHIGLLPSWAKEVRIFGLAGWLVEQYGREWLAVMSQLWRARRADHRAMGMLGCVAFAAHVTVVLLLAG
jgi:ATP-binding cassette, subfamily B, bacterial